MRFAVKYHRLLLALFAAASLATLLYTVGAPGQFAP